MENTEQATKLVAFDPVEIGVRMLKLALHGRESVFYVSRRCRTLIELGFSHSKIRRLMTRFIKRRIRTLVYRANFAVLHDTIKHALKIGFSEDLLTRAVENSYAKAFGKSIVCAKRAAEFLQ